MADSGEISDPRDREIADLKDQVTDLKRQLADLVLSQILAADSRGLPGVETQEAAQPGARRWRAASLPGRVSAGQQERYYVLIEGTAHEFILFAPTRRYTRSPARATPGR